ncbi:MAG: hypothetical protein CMJ18_21405 [Phycisphaeraceae bacterium]|nr:hypothetical protein [Phycisphaeraceae bacterium]
MRRSHAGWIVATTIVGLWAAQWLSAQPEASSSTGWTRGKGWGWIWGADDEVGALNAMTPDTVSAALSLARSGRIYDLGVPYDRTSFKWPGHSPGEILTFRSPEGVKRQKDLPQLANPAGTAWHSCALFINDNVATQIDGLAHATTGADNHWYNGFKEEDWGGDWGPRKCDANSIPPVVTRGVLIDMAGYKGVDALESNYSITVADVKGALQKQGVALKVGDTVLVRTGTLRYWKESGADHAKIKEHDSAGMSFDATKYLIEQGGAIMVGSDTSGYESWPTPDGSRSFMPGHDYLLIEQGVHIGEFHYLEDLARDGVYEFCYIALVNRIRGTTAGFCMRPIAIR